MLALIQHLTALRRKLALWGHEHALVAEEACAVSMQRILVMGPVMIFLYGLNTLVYAIKWNKAVQGTATQEWALSVTELFGTALTLAIGIVYFAYSRRDQAPKLWHPWFVCFVSLLGLVVTSILVALNQRITPSTSPYTLACMLLAVALYMRPAVSAAIFMACATVFYVFMGMTQADPNLLLTNRLNGMGASLLGWGVSCLMFRSFTTITLQRRQLHAVNAELVSQHEQLRQLARCDGLTGLYNRSTFFELAQTELNHARQHQKSIAIIMLDLDHFKQVNDYYGHPGGDAALCHAAHVIASHVRKSDQVGRLGGEEFIILLPATTDTDARHLAEKLRCSLESSPAAWNGEQITVTASFGVAHSSNPESIEFDSLYYEADKALYQAKQKGRNCVV